MLDHLRLFAVFICPKNRLRDLRISLSRCEEGSKGEQEGRDLYPIACQYVKDFRLGFQTVPFSRHHGDGLDLEGDDPGFDPAVFLSASSLQTKQPIDCDAISTRRSWEGSVSYRTLGNDLIQTAVHVGDAG